MTTFYTANRNYPKPDFDSAAWHVQMNQALDMIDLDTAAYFMSPSLVVEAWTQNTAYNLNDKVLDIPRNQLFLCEVGHTSGGDFLADRTAHPDWWSAFGVPLVPRGQWANGVIYHVLDHVYDDVQGIIALCSIAHTSAPTGTIKGPSEIGNWLFVADNSTLIVSINNSAAAAAASASQAAASASAASASAASALASKNAAANSEANSAGYATNASAYATSAGNSASAASASATAAANSATNASTSATNAANSAAAAAASAASVPGPSNAAPLMNGSAVPGVAALVSRGDHVHPSDTSRVAKAGDSMSGSLAIQTVNPALVLSKVASGQSSQIWGQLNGLTRWLALFGDGAPESVNDLGSNLAFYRYNDAGVFIDSPFSIDRSTGVATFTKPVPSIVPVGVIFPFAGPGSGIPAGWFACNGQNVSRTGNPNLYAIIGGYYGVGDGSTTFGLPDLRGRVPTGIDDMGTGAAGRIHVGAWAGGLNSVGLGGIGGEELHTPIGQEQFIHNHGHNHVPSNGGTFRTNVGGGANYLVSSTTLNSGSSMDQDATSNSGGALNQAHNTLSPTLLINYIIRGG